MSAEEQQNKPFKIKLHPMLDEKTLNAISDATLAAIDDQLCKPPALTPDDIGKDIKGEGIYLGTYEPIDRDGKSLSRIFNVFAAPEDLPGGTRAYVNTVKEVASLKNFHGHDGTDYDTDKELYAALKDGTYNGGWIIPTRDILHGKDSAFKNTFKMTASSGSGYPQWYWSCTERREDPSNVWGADFSDGDGGWLRKDDFRLACRPVRLVPV